MPMTETELFGLIARLQGAVKHPMAIVDDYAGPLDFVVLRPEEAKAILTQLKRLERGHDGATARAGA